MNKLFVSIALAAILMVPATVTADHDATDVYTDISGNLYVDDDPLPYIYLESNGVAGLQRDDDGNQDGHPGHDNPDTWVF